MAAGVGFRCLCGNGRAATAGVVRREVASGIFLQHLHQLPVTALEWDSALVDLANARAQQHGLPLTSVRVDVLEDRAGDFMQPQQNVVALHACGELHERLLHLAVAKGVRQLQAGQSPV